MQGCSSFQFSFLSYLLLAHSQDPICGSLMEKQEEEEEGEEGLADKMVLHQR